MLCWQIWTNMWGSRKSPVTMESCFGKLPSSLKNGKTPSPDIRHHFTARASLPVVVDTRCARVSTSMVMVLERDTYLGILCCHEWCDALLRWPLWQKVTFMLLDQNNVEHVIDSFRPDPNSSSFQRPRRETNIASGCLTFCPLLQLNDHAYVRDDTMFLKVMVDTTDL